MLQPVGITFFVRHLNETPFKTQKLTETGQLDHLANCPRNRKIKAAESSVKRAVLKFHKQGLEAVRRHLQLEETGHTLENDEDT